MLSRNSVASAWVESEVEAAFEKERAGRSNVLFPIRLDSECLESDRAWLKQILRTRQIADFTSWKNTEGYRTAFQRLLVDLALDKD